MVNNPKTGVFDPTLQKILTDLQTKDLFLTATEIIEILMQGKDLNYQQSLGLFRKLLENELTQEQLCSILSLQAKKGIAKDELVGAIAASRKHAVLLQEQVIPSRACLDIVGTGGDKQNLLNMSTASALVAAAMGYPVTKHGNSGVSSLTGASDVLIELGLNFKLNPTEAIELLDKTKFSFLFAPIYHGSFRHASAARKELGIPTIFNILGPLVNPFSPGKTLVGVCKDEVFQLYSEVLLELNQNSINFNNERKFIICQGKLANGQMVDEINLSGSTNLAIINNSKVENLTLEASDFGLPVLDLESIRGQNPAYNAQQIKLALAGQHDALGQAIAATLAVAFYMDSKTDLKQNTQEVLEFLATKKAKTYFEFLLATNQELLAKA